mmetsp:Transcript_18679/g.43751  ORF Transcript_18679/g.43751 Transcript_18679/m.43751 type:complete len:339 (+) Transcript_18679:148-1164(+)
MRSPWGSSTISTRLAKISVIAALCTNGLYRGFRWYSDGYLGRVPNLNEQTASLSTTWTEHQQQQQSVEDRLQRMATLTSPPTEIYVLGERNSGTNFAANVLRRAFVPPNVVDPSRTHEYFSSDIPILKHKHMFRHHILTQEELEEIRRRRDILWILAVRQPCAWAEAMQRIPWHLCYPLEHDECQQTKFIGMEHKSDTKQLSLSRFFGMQWADWPEAHNFRNLSFVGEDFVYKNVFELRAHKLRIMKQIIEAVPRNVKIVRFHELERSPEVFIQNLVQEFNLTLRPHYKHQPASDKIHREICLREPALKVAQREINWETESYFGFNFLDCHLCYQKSS